MINNTEVVRNEVFWLSTYGFGKMVFVSHSCKELWGRECKELYQDPRAFLTHIHPDDLKEYCLVLEEYHHKGVPYHCEYRVRFPGSDEIKLINEKAYPAPGLSGNEQIMIGISMDITKQKNTEASILESEARLQMFFESTQDLISLTDEYANTIWANPAWKNFFGEDMGRRSDPFSNIHPDDVNRVMMAWNKLIHKEVRIQNLKYRFKNPQGEYIVFESSAYKVIIDGKKRFYILARNITKREHAEKKLSEKNQQLRALAAHLQSIREEERLRIAREVHDEFGQVLSALKMDLSSIERKVKNFFKPDIHQEILEDINDSKKIIAESVKFVRRLITELRPEVLDIHGLIPALEWQLDEFSKRTKVNSRFIADLDGIDLGQDKNIAVFRVFQEALNNITKHAVANEVDVKVTKKDHAFWLSVKDNGKGFNVNKIDQGKSFGLLGMKERILLCGGILIVKSEKGKGTELQIKISQ